MTAYVAPIVLKEYQTERLPGTRISPEAGERLWAKFRDKISISPPSFQNGYQWELTSLGWAGFIPFSDDLSFHLKPKVPLENLFGMLDYAYRLKSIQWLPKDYQSETLQDFYSTLAKLLAKRILDRGRKGYYRNYITKRESLPYTRGKLDVRSILAQPWNPKLHCEFQEITADIEDNQILAWTLHLILLSGMCLEDSRQVVRNSYGNICQVASPLRFTSRDCTDRSYNRLNEDYQTLHALCRFFLENSGPSYEVGNHSMVPFLVDMAHLYELFVAEWLRANLPPDNYELKDQETLKIGENEPIHFKIDLVIYDKLLKQPMFVLDTKYKNPTSPAPEDITQITFYAAAKNCGQAVLIYPAPLQHPFDAVINGIHIRTVSFSLDGDLQKAGEKLLDQLGI